MEPINNKIISIKKNSELKVIYKLPFYLSYLNIMNNPIGTLYKIKNKF